MKSNTPTEKIRNVAIIAHVDHGKTTLVDAFIKQSSQLQVNQEEMQQDCILDFNELERERGITIQAKSISIPYREYMINIIDTPGHADFGGEVERTLHMADGCVLLVDAQEGVMPQTKFVLKKALELGLKPIVVVNKIDKKLAKPADTLSKVQDLFLELATDPDQLEFPTFYAVGRNGQVFTELPTEKEDALSDLQADTTPLLDAMIETIPSPTPQDDQPFRMQVTAIEYDPHLGRQLIGRVDRGVVNTGDPIAIVSPPEGESASETSHKTRVKAMSARVGLHDIAIEQAHTGEIVRIIGADDANVGDTLCDPSAIEPMPAIKVSPPSLRIKIEANTSPFLGKEGEFASLKQLQNRLEHEKLANVSLRIEKADDGAYTVAGRGELHLAVFIETLRREGYEFQIRKPEIIITEVDGKKMEPLEEVFIEVAEEYQGVITKELGQRKAELVAVEPHDSMLQYTYRMRTRDLLGLKRILVTATNGNIVMHNRVVDLVEWAPHPEEQYVGRLISATTGKALAYAMNSLQDRGQFFIEPNTDVYEGMIIGIGNTDRDIMMNPTKAREKNNVRMSRAEITLVNLKAPIPLTIEYALGFLQDDEILEVTPKNLRLRKKYLNKQQRFDAEKRR